LSERLQTLCEDRLKASLNAFHSLIRGPLALACLVSVASSGTESPRSAAETFDRVTSVTAFDTDSSGNPEAFHLGTAAGPFGWSSAVADFDDDGRPDFAVADRIEAQSDGGYRYRILFAVAGTPSLSVSFDSPSPALSVVVEDVDDDHDLDVLVRDAPSAIVDTIWLNDGHGRFVPRHEGASPGPRISSTSVTEAPDAHSPAAALQVAGPSLNPVRTVVEVLRDTGPTGTLCQAAIQSSTSRTAPSRAPPAICSDHSI
jgi:hypothetical protein